MRWSWPKLMSRSPGAPRPAVQSTPGDRARSDGAPLAVPTGPSARPRPYPRACWQTSEPTSCARPMSATSAATEGAGVIHVRGKGSAKPHRADRGRARRGHRALPRQPCCPPQHRPACRRIRAWRCGRPTSLFVGRDGDRHHPRYLQSRIKRAFHRAGPDAQPVPEPSCTVCAIPMRLSSPKLTSASTPLMKLLGLWSWRPQPSVTCPRAGSETHSAAAEIPWRHSR